MSLSRRSTRRLASGGLLLLCGLIAPTLASAQTPYTAPVGTSIYVRSGSGGIYDYELDLQSNGLLTGSTGWIQGANGSAFNVDGVASIGQKPYAFMSGQATSTGFGSALGTARAEVAYDVGVSLPPPWSSVLAGTTIPVVVQGFTFVRLIPVLPFASGGFANATVEINGPGVSFFEFSAVTGSFGCWPPQDVDGWRETLDVSPGAAYRVRLVARGNGVGCYFWALSDPVFQIDPEATFDYDGQTYFYEDVASLVYSEGIEAPEPGFAAALATGALVVALGGAPGRRRGASIRLRTGSPRA